MIILTLFIMGGLAWVIFSLDKIEKWQDNFWNTEDKIFKIRIQQQRENQDHKFKR